MRTAFRSTIGIALALWTSAAPLSADEVILADRAFPETSLSLRGPQIRQKSRQFISAETVVELRSSDKAVGGRPASGVKQVLYRLDAGPFRPYEAEFTVPEGFHRLEFYAMDNAGNTEPLHAEDLFVDGRPPESKVVFEGDARNVNDEVVLSNDTRVGFEASDPYWTESSVSELRNISYRVDGGDPEIFFGPFPLAPGRHTVEFFSVDRLGNEEPARTVVVSVQQPLPGDALAGEEFADSGAWAAPSF